ncbi:MAG: phosphoribosylamine--glycine ligase [Sphaerochaetaceae bacterium]|nr:phosphoribosylamine--glycine ligase [Sphaerochaetaceae bacterium]
MKVLVLGSGAKDHAVAWWFSKSKQIEDLYMAPASPATRDFAKGINNIDITNGEQVLKACRDNSIDFVFIGTEAPLMTGVVDILNENGISTFGTPTKAMKLEADKKFAKDFARRNGVNTPDYRIFTDMQSIQSFLDENPGRTFVIKPNDISPSRIMARSADKAVLLAFAEKLIKKSPVVLETFAEGIPLTISLFVDENGGTLMLPICSEYTKSEHGDKGLATGGMGAVCPVPMDYGKLSTLYNQIINPTMDGLRNEGLIYKGIITFSVVSLNGDYKLVDYHVRFNDPAAQTIIPLIKNDVVDIMNAMKKNCLSAVTLQTTGDSAVSVVIASDGYPVKPRIGLRLRSVAEPYFSFFSADSTRFFFGAVKTGEDSGLYTSGGRVATAVACGENIIEANKKVYGAINAVTFKGAWHREDIGNKFFDSVSSAV